MSLFVVPFLLLTVYNNVRGFPILNYRYAAHQINTYLWNTGTTPRRVDLPAASPLAIRGGSSTTHAVESAYPNRGGLIIYPGTTRVNLPG
eukprot:SAG11_NODE_3040_length_2740_cov_15.737978_3_plen_90_part_00